MSNRISIKQQSNLRTKGTDLLIGHSLGTDLNDQSLGQPNKECPNLPAFGDVPYVPAEKERPQVPG